MFAWEGEPVMNMKKKIVMLAVVALMVCSFCGAVCDIDYLPHWGEEIKRIIEPGMTLSGTTPDDGIPGGPPGNPG